MEVVSDDPHPECFEELFGDLEQLNEGLDNVDIEDGLQELASVQSHGRQTFTFLEEDDEFQRILAEGGVNPYARMDKWAVNRFNAFRAFKGLDVSLQIADMPSHDLAFLLTKFFEQACKKDGSLYPTQSLMSLYRGFHRVLRRAQEVRIQSTGIDEPRFSMKTSPLFLCVGRACVLAMRRSRTHGANLPRKKASLISMADEEVILSHSCTSKTNGRGLQKRCAYYMLSRFCIRAGSELWSLRAGEFMLGADEHGEFVKYDERLSKNYRVSMERYQDEHFRVPITEYDADVHDTMSLMIKHAPRSVKSEDRFLFYQAIDNPRSVSWFSSARVSARNLCEWMKMIHEECGLLTDGITNKSGRTTCVTHMAAEGVPAAVGMMITGHKSTGAYARYDRSTEARVRAAQKCVAEGTDFVSNVKDETQKLKGILIDNRAPPERQIVASSSKKQRAITMEGNSNESAVGVSLNTNPNAGIVAVNENANPNVVVAAKENADPNLGVGIAKKDDGVSVQTTLDYDKWAYFVDWDKLEGNLASKGVLSFGSNVINPITAVFGKNVIFGNNCNISICVGSSSDSSRGVAGAMGGLAGAISGDGKKTPDQAGSSGNPK